MRKGTILARRRRQKNIKRGILAVFVILAAFVIFIAVMVIGKPAKGKITSSNLQASSTVANSAPNNLEAGGNYIKFTYPDIFRQVPTDVPSSPQLENFNFVTKKFPFWELSLGVSKLPSGNLADDGSYNMRARAPENYKLEHWMISSNSVPVFSDIRGQYSKAAFITHSGMLLAVALTGPGDTSIMQQQQTEIIKSLSWIK